MKKLNRGDQVHARVMEVLSDGDLLVDVEGHLIRVANKTGQEITLQQIIPLTVLRTSPLRFEMTLRSHRRRLNLFG